MITESKGHQSDDELLRRFLLEVTKSFTIFEKRYYDYAVLESGFERDVDRFFEEIRRVVAAHDHEFGATPGMAVPAGRESKIDIPRLSRPLIIQAKADTARDAGVQKMFGQLKSLLEARGRSLVVYPAHSSLSFLGQGLARDLRSSLKLTNIVPSHSIDTDISEAFCRSARDLFEVQLKSSVQFIGASIRQPGRGREGYHTSYLELEGAGIYVAVLVSVPAAALPVFAQRMTGATSLSESTALSSLGEFLNIVGGGARGQLNASGYALKPMGLPKIFGPDEVHDLAATDSSTALEVRLRTDVADCILELRFFT